MVSLILFWKSSDLANDGARPMESPSLHSKGHLPTRHHLPLLQRHDRRLGDLRDLRSLVLCDRHRQFPMVPLGRHTHHKHQRTTDRLHRRRFKHYACASIHPRQLDPGLQQRSPLHEHHSPRPASEYRHHNDLHP